MTKAEIKKIIGQRLDEIENKEAFCKQQGIDKSDYYPYAFGYLIAELKSVLVDVDTFKH